MSKQLDPRLAKQLAGRCCYSGCREQAADGSDYCAPHDAHERGRDAGKKRRRRQRLADAGQCLTGCGAKVTRRRRPDGTVVPRRCRECRESHAKKCRESRAKKCREDRKDASVPGAVPSVPGAPSNWRTDNSGRNGTEVLRYHGRSRRGRLSREEQLDEDARDARFAVAELEKFIRAVGVLKRTDLQSLPPIQRVEAKRQASLFLGSAGRFIDELLEKYDS